MCITARELSVPAKEIFILFCFSLQSHSHSPGTMCHCQKRRKARSYSQEQQWWHSQLWPWGSCSRLCWDANHEEVPCTWGVVQAPQLGNPSVCCRRFCLVIGCLQDECRAELLQPPQTGNGRSNCSICTKERWD